MLVGVEVISILLLLILSIYYNMESDSSLYFE